MATHRRKQLGTEEKEPPWCTSPLLRNARHPIEKGAPLVLILFVLKALTTTSAVAAFSSAFCKRATAQGTARPARPSLVQNSSCQQRQRRHTTDLIGAMRMGASHPTTAGSQNFFRIKSTPPAPSLGRIPVGNRPCFRRDYLLGRSWTPAELNTMAMADSSSSAEGGESVPPNDVQTMPSAIFSLIKACVGGGVLSLPAGVAMIGDVPAALFPASILISVLGALSAYCFFMIGRICYFAEATNGRSTHHITSLGEAWEKEVGKNNSWLITLACFLMTSCAALAYSIMLGDAVSSLAATAGIKGIFATRHASIIAVTIAALYPLCSLQSLAALTPVSVLGVTGTLITCGFMGVRSMPGSPYSLPDGMFLPTIEPHLRPVFSLNGMSKALSPSALVLGSMAATSYLVHFSAPDFYNALKDNTLKRFGILSSVGFGCVVIINVLMMAFGFLTFGAGSSGVILNNYSNMDVWAGVCRLLMTISIVGTYPFLFSGIKTAFFQFKQKGGNVSKELNRKTTQLILTIITGLALLVEDAGFVVSFNGAIMGSAIIYVFPAIIYLKSTARRIKNGEMKKSKRVKLERALNRLLIGVGTMIGVVGGIVSVLTSFYPHLLL